MNEGSDLEYRVSRCGVVYYRNDGVVWDDYREHHQYGLPAEAEQVLRHFVSWKPLGSARYLTPGVGSDERVSSTISLLLSAHILIEQGSSEHRAEESLLAAWGPWSHLTRAYHTSTEFPETERFLTEEETKKLLSDRSTSTPPEPVHYAHPSRQSDVPLPAVAPEGGGHSLIDVLRKRRSVRDFAGEPVPYDSIGYVLRTLALPTWVAERSQTALKAVPSGGGRHPTELYMHATNIAGLGAGVYHLNTGTACLERIAGPATREDLIFSCGEQEWVADAGALLFYTSRIKRNQWKYTHSRSYRILHYDVGHFAQSVALMLVDTGLASTFTAALREDPTRRLLNVQTDDELVMGCTVIGAPRS